jgi:MoaA/NifB/PqqE/SkfB family radical SAM enzyme
VDVFDLRIELGLAVRKLEEASFDLVNAYLDSLEPRVDELCAKHGLKGIKRVIELVPEEDIRRAQLAALRERERITRPPEIVEAYKEILGVPVEVGEEAAKPLKEELHPEFAKMKEEEEAAKAAEAAKPEEGAAKRARAPRKKGGRSK